MMEINYKWNLWPSVFQWMWPNHVANPRTRTIGSLHSVSASLPTSINKIRGKKKKQLSLSFQPTDSGCVWKLFHPPSKITLMAKMMIVRTLGGSPKFSEKPKYHHHHHHQPLDYLLNTNKNYQQNNHHSWFTWYKSSFFMGFPREFPTFYRSPRAPGHLLRLPSRPHSSSGASPPSPARRTSAECCSKPPEKGEMAMRRQKKTIHCVFVCVLYIYTCVCVCSFQVCATFLVMCCGSVVVQLGSLGIRMPFLLGTKSANRNITSVASGCKGRELLKKKLVPLPSHVFTLLAIQ